MAVELKLPCFVCVATGASKSSAVMVGRGLNADVSFGTNSSC